MTESGGIRVVSRAIAILEALSEHPELRPGELATQIGEPRSSVYRLLAALEQHDLVAPTGSNGSYELGNHLCTLGMSVLNRFADVRDAATPIIERLYESTHQTVFLTVRRRYESVCVERLDGELVNVMVQPVGGVMPLHAGATARALLAYESRQFWDEYLATGPFRSFTAKTETDPAAIVAELEWILEHSYAISDEDVIAGIASLGAAIFDRRNRVRASLSLSGPRPAILGDATETTTQLVLDAANAISDRLGATRKLALSH